jgi:acyl-CoA synthetase (NDP forming)
MMDLVRALVLWKGKTGGPRIGVLTFSGASGIVAADHLDRRGMTLAHLSEDTIRVLRTVFPEWMEPMNPVDLWPAIERVGRKAYIVALEALLKDRGVDGIYVHVYVDEAFLNDIVAAFEAIRNADKFVAVWAIGDTRCFPALRSHVEPLGAPVFGEVARGALALSLALGPAPYAPIDT